MKRKDYPRKSWLARVDSLKKELDLWDEFLEIKLIKEVLDKKECEKLQSISKLQVYMELKLEIGFEEYLEYVKAAPSRLFFKFCSGTHGLCVELGRHAGGVDHENVLIVGLVRNRSSMFLLNVHHLIPRD